MFKNFSKQLKENFAGPNRKRFVWLGVLALVLIAAGGGYGYYKLVYLPANTVSASSELQTATVRTGDLVIYASGSGTLTANDEVNLAFRTGGQVTKVNVAVGDLVKKGDTLAQVDDTSAQISVTQAKRALAELTSVNAIATAQEAVANAETNLADARESLEYLISPTVLHWEEEVTKAEQAVKDAQAAVDASPSDKTAQQNLKDAQAYLQHAQASLVGAQASYTDEYLPNNFTVKSVDRVTHQVTKYVAAPTEADITAARAAYAAAQAALDEATVYLAVLSGSEIPENATGSSLGELEQAKLDLESAQYTLDGTRLTTPIDGTVMSVDVGVGDTVGTSSVMTVADLTHPTLEVFLDASDWTNVKAGYKAEVTFDMLPDTTYTGVVTQVDPGLYSESGTSVVRAIVTLDGVDASFNVPLGASASVDVIGGEARNTVLVPIEALHKAGDQYTVFVMDNGKLKLRVIEIGIQDSIYAEVKSGLEAGEVVSTGITETK